MAKSSSVQYHSNSTITCGTCGSVYTVSSFFESLKIDICGSCHPVYTGKSILIDTAGQLKKFQDRVAKSTSNASTVKPAKKVRSRRTIQTFEDIENQPA